MPLLLPIHELRPGMRLSDPFLYRGRVMLTAGKVVNQADLDVLRRHYAGEMIRVGDPILDQLVEFEDDTHDRDVARKAQGSIAKCMTDVGHRIASRASLTGQDYRMMSSAATDLMRYLIDHPVSAALLHRTLDSRSYLADHTGAVFYLSMVLGAAVKSYVLTERHRQTSAKSINPQTLMDLTPLGLGAMFMDLGMFPLAKLYDGTRHTLCPEDIQMLHEHPITGADMLPESFPTVARVIVRTHHENYNGTGYPNRIEGDRLHVFARIVRICDSFAAATTKTLYREAKTPARVIWEMTVGPYSRYYDPVLAKMFSRLIQPFPIGAKLRLTDGRYAVVVRYNRKDPFRPTLIIAFDADNQRLPDDQLSKPLQLHPDGDLALASFGDEDLTYLCEIPSPDFDAEPHRREIRTLFDAAYP